MYHDNLTDTHKLCSICNEWKEHKDFRPSKTGAGKLSGKCNTCTKSRYRQTSKAKAVRKEYDTIRRYGISCVEIELLLEKQGNKCAICSSDLTGTRIHIDHCHSTKDVRGVLCHTCNVGVGMFKDDTKLLEKAIAYLLNARNV